MAAKGYQYQTEFAKKYLAVGKAEGKAVGKAEALFDILEERGLPVSQEDRERILASTDIGQLNAWVRKAVWVTSVDQLFEPRQVQ